MYIKPKLERFGTFRELTLTGLFGGNDSLLCGEVRLPGGS
jgi:hypothetical protein